MTPERRKLYLEKMLEGGTLHAFKTSMEMYIEVGLLKKETTIAEAFTAINKKLTDLAQELVILKAPPDLEDSVREFFEFTNPKLGEPHADEKTDDS